MDHDGCFEVHGHRFHDVGSETQETIKSEESSK